MSGECKHCGKKGFDFDLAYGSGPDCLNPRVDDPAVGGWACQYKPAEPAPNPKTLGEIISAARAGERPGYDDLRLALCAMDHLMTFDRTALERLAVAEKEGMRPFLTRSAVYQCEEHHGRVSRALEKTPLAFLGENNNPDNPGVQAERRQALALVARFLEGAKP